MDSSFMHRFLWGIVAIAVGAVFLLNHLGVITMSIGEFFSLYWPVFVILFGVQGMLLQKKGVFWWNPFVVLIGFLFLGRNLEWFDWDLSDMVQLLWPIVLILFGVSMIFKGGRRSKRTREDDEQWNPIVPPEPPTPPIPPIPPMPPGPPPAPPADGEPFGRPEAANPPPPPPWNASAGPGEPIRDWKDHTQEWKEQWKDAKREWKDAKREWKSNHQGHRNWQHSHEHQWHHGHGKRCTHSRFIGDVYLGHDYWELTPMSISHFIGDTTLDLTKAQVPIGETRIEVSSFIGDVKVYVPNDTRIGVQVVSSCLIGDVKVLDQKRGGMFNHISVESPGYADAEQRVILVMSSFMGDVRVMKVG
ncbi:cell wall-active antibiotics response protein LiaF [Cohnella sp. GCM10027633]|uniref:cell wall-active antibiotics response protein LiaF n=1 Tax=unclassified Cohnella TaxID=2636738 RepID=UPI00363C2480